MAQQSGLKEYKVPPFSLLDTRQEYWQERRRAWLRFGMQSEIGRDEKLTYGKFDQQHKERIQEKWTTATAEEREELLSAKYIKDDTRKKYGDGSTSIFDPVLTEIMYLWFCPEGGTILDPFAGGSVRGIVAASLGHPYMGVELRKVQVDANREQAQAILNEQCPAPLWINGDSNQVLNDSLPKMDFLFTCPPYADLEVYSDDPSDLSNMKSDEFDSVYSNIMHLAAGHLEDNRFAAIVVSNIRDKQGHVRDLVGLTTKAMEAGGARLYNEAVLMNAAGTAALRAKKQFVTSRKIVKIHQNVLVFVKGNPREAAALCER